MNKKTKGALAICGVLVALVALRMALVAGGSGDDQKLIEAALQRSIDASKQGRPGGVMDLLSNNLKFNDMDTSGNRSQIAKLIRDSRPDVEVENKTAVVRGDEAFIESPVKLQMNFLGQSREWNLKDVVMVFSREQAREFLIIPTTQWKLSQITMPPNAIPDFMQP